MHDDLVARGRALTGGDDRPGEEEAPETEPAVAVLLGHVLLVAEPVLVPVEDGLGVVDTDSLDRSDLDFEI